MSMTLRPAALAVGALSLLAACGDSASNGAGGDTTAAPTTAATPTTTTAVIDPGDGGEYAVRLDPADFVHGVDHPYLPLVPGSRWVYEGDSDGETERIVVEVLAETRTIEGIQATVVRDTVEVGGELVEDTYDWFAQDAEGNVWYLGEDTHEYEDGVAVNDDGAWEHGKDGAIGGITMPAAPTVGFAYRQEFYAGEAKDMGEILAVGVAKETGFGSFSDVVVTEDWSPLEPAGARGHRGEVVRPRRREHLLHARGRQGGHGGAGRVHPRPRRLIAGAGESGPVQAGTCTMSTHDDEGVQVERRTKLIAAVTLAVGAVASSEPGSPSPAEPTTTPPRRRSPARRSTGPWPPPSSTRARVGSPVPRSMTKTAATRWRSRSTTARRSTSSLTTTSPLSATNATTTPQRTSRTERWFCGRSRPPCGRERPQNLEGSPA